MSDFEDDSGFLGARVRTWRHNPCLMQPISLVMFIISGIFMFTTLVLQFPTFVLGVLMAPVLARSSWYVEFLYPWDIARYAHFLLIKKSSKTDREDDKNRGFHSRTIEQRIEVIPGRVYIHPIPQWIDNLGWLTVCLPMPRTESKENARVTIEDNTDSIVAFLVDCGDADATIRAITLIQQFHYSKKPIHVHAILSTHKHHDHTGGNKDFLSHPIGSKVSKVYAGAIERVPECNHLLANGDKIDLPKSGSNDMNELLEVEVVAVPGHTRGSLVFRLASKIPNGDAEFMFTGDTMFCGGGGVPFEADIGKETDSQLNRSHGNTFVKAGIGQVAMERCFAEILSRSMPAKGPDADLSSVLIFPGHEYTQELLSRQFHNNMNEACRWKNFSPQVFFDTVSQMFVAFHRRSLPHNSGKLLVIPSTLLREISINPQIRSLARAGELIIRAVTFWYSNFCRHNGTIPTEHNSRVKNQFAKQPSERKTSSTLKRWTLDSTDACKDIFATMYKADIEDLIDDLTAGRVSRKEAARKLQEATWRLKEPVVNRRAIPGFMPSDKGIYKGIAALVLLGSPPSAMTLLDSRRMNLPPPVDSNSDKIKISMNRLVVVLGRLGLLENHEANFSAMIKLLWEDASKYVEEGANPDVEKVATPNFVDKIELGVLKWVIFGVPSNQPSFFSKLFCMPCSTVSVPRQFPEHPASKMKKKAGDLVSHDVLTCPICRNATGCLEVKGHHETKGGDQWERPTREMESNEADFGDEGGFEAMQVITSNLLPKEID